MQRNRPTVPGDPLGSVTKVRKLDMENQPNRTSTHSKKKLHQHNSYEINIVLFLSECSQHLLIHHNQNYFR